MKSLALAAVLGVWTFGCAPRAPAVDRAAETTRVRTLVQQLTTALENEDMTLFSQVMAHGPETVAFGAGAGERWVGWDALAQGIQNQFDAYEDTKLTVRDQTIALGAGGDVAWFSQVVDWDANAGGRPVQRVGSRLTGVLERRNDAWVCVQLHLSAPAAPGAIE